MDEGYSQDLIPPHREANSFDENHTFEFVDERLFEGLDRVADQFNEFRKRELLHPTRAFHRISELVHRQCLEIQKLEECGVAEAQILDRLEGVRKLYSKSRFISRLQTWPRGYPGDFQTIEYLCDARNQSLDGTLEYYLEEIALSCPLAQQHRNKVQWQAQQIFSCISRDPDSESRILLVGCGGGQDLKQINFALRTANVFLVLNDIDEGALSLVGKRLTDLRQKPALIKGDIFKTIHKMKGLGPYDLILAGGLFDYLPDRHAILLLKKMKSMVSRRGRICFTNILDGNPWRVWIEYLSNWKLIERSTEDICSLIRAAGLDEFKVELAIDSSGLASLVEIAISENLPQMNYVER